LPLSLIKPQQDFFVTLDRVDGLPQRIGLFGAESVSNLEPFHGQDSYSTADLS